MTSHPPSLYVPDAFRETDLRRLFEIVERYSFAMLITGAPSGPLVSHVPFLLDRGLGERGTLYGHVARANPHWQALEDGQSTVVFSGPHAYVSPSWYAPRPDNVPTWNYAVVHATGQPKLVSGGPATLRILKRFAEAYESGLEGGYTVDVDGPVLARIAKGVVAFEIPIAELTGKFKLSQNRPEPDRRRVAEQLGGGADPLGRELAELMKLTHE